MNFSNLSKTVSLFVIAFVVSCSASISCEPGPEHGLGIHTGVLDLCKNYILAGVKPKDLSVNDDNPEFKKIDDWVRKNLLNDCYIAAKIDGKEHAKAWLVLSSARLPQKTVPDGISKIFLTIPLTNQTLGPTFRKKIVELQELMKGTLQNYSEAAH